MDDANLYHALKQFKMFTNIIFLHLGFILPIMFSLFLDAFFKIKDTPRISVSQS